MSLLDLLALYGLAGVVCALAVWRRRRDRERLWLSLLLALLLWPLWGPFALMEPRPAAEPDQRAAPQPPPSPLARRLELQLDKAVAAAEGTAFAAMLGPAAAARMSCEIRQASTRLCELDKLLQAPGFDRAAALARVDELLQQSAHEPALARQLRSARLHLDNVERLARLQLAQQRALSELEQAIGALHSQLVVARYAGSGEEGVSTIVSDLWSRVEGLGEVLEPEAAADCDNVVRLSASGGQDDPPQRAAEEEQKLIAVGEQTALSRGA